MPKFASTPAELKAKGEKLCDCDACKLALRSSTRRITSPRSPCGSSAATAGPTTSASAAWTTSWPPDKDVNVFVFDTEVYSNTGGQASKASNIGQVAQFAAAGKETKKKSLAEIAMSYGYVYVAQVAMGANPAQTIKAISEAEAYHGPSLIIGYAPCEMHSIKGGMINCQKEMKKAVECGYWNLFRFNPAAEEEVHARLQGAGRRLSGVPDERGPLQPPDPRVPRARRRAVRAQRGSAKERYEHLAQAHRPVRQAVIAVPTV